MSEFESNAAFIPGSLLFCPDCGTLLDFPLGDADHVKCDMCGHVEPASCMYLFYVLLALLKGKPFTRV